MDVRPTHFERVREPCHSAWYCPDSELGTGGGGARTTGLPTLPELAVAARQSEVASS